MPLTESIVKSIESIQSEALSRPMYSSGFYTATFNPINNITFDVVNGGYYQHIGNTLTVWQHVAATVLVVANPALLTMSLPSGYLVGGSDVRVTGSVRGARIESSSISGSTGTVVFEYKTLATASQHTWFEATVWVG